MGRVRQHAREHDHRGGHGAHLGALHRAAKWTVEANPRGGRKAERAADLVREGLLEAPMEVPWNAVVAKAGTGATFRGASIHEQVLRRRSDGRWVTGSLEDRPMHTVKAGTSPTSSCRGAACGSRPRAAGPDC